MEAQEIIMVNTSFSPYLRYHEICLEKKWTAWMRWNLQDYIFRIKETALFMKILGRLALTFASGLSKPNDSSDDRDRLIYLSAIITY